MLKPKLVWVRKTVGHWYKQEYPELQQLMIMHASEELLNWQLPSSDPRQLKHRTYITFSAAESEVGYYITWMACSDSAGQQRAQMYQGSAFVWEHCDCATRSRLLPESKVFLSFGWMPGTCHWLGFQDFWFLLLIWCFRETVHNESKAFSLQSYLGVQRSEWMCMYIGTFLSCRSPSYTYQDWISVVN